jgi:hypothetical protein
LISKESENVKGGEKMYEIRPWKRENCTLKIEAEKFTRREIFSEEINNMQGEGGGLNANYKNVEAAVFAANLLGRGGLIYGQDFIFKTVDCMGVIIFDFRDEDTRDKAASMLPRFFCAQNITSCRNHSECALGGDPSRCIWFYQ